MAGDRGLSFVVVGLITLSALWVTITRGSYPSGAANAAKDAAFLQFAAERHRAEVLIAELAMKRATTSALKQLAARMVADYAQRLGELAHAQRFDAVRIGPVDGGAREAEVGDADGAVVPDHDVARVEVAVDEAHGVRGGEAARGARENAEDLLA